MELDKYFGLSTKDNEQLVDLRIERKLRQAMGEVATFMESERKKLENLQVKHNNAFASVLTKLKESDEEWRKDYDIQQQLAFNKWKSNYDINTQKKIDSVVNERIKDITAQNNMYRDNLSNQLSSQNNLIADLKARFSRNSAVDVNRIVNQKVAQIQAIQNQNTELVQNYMDAQRMNIEEWKKRWVSELMDQNDNWRNNYDIQQQQKLSAWKGQQESLVANLIEDKIKLIAIETKDIYTTKVHTWTNEAVNTTIKRLRETGGTGTIDQLLLVSDGTSYNLHLELDNNILFDKPYSYFNSYSDDLVNISAITSGSTYKLSLRNLQFKERLNIYIVTTASTTFSEIVLRYTVRDEVKIE